MTPKANKKSSPTAKNPVKGKRSPRHRQVHPIVKQLERAPYQQPILKEAYKDIRFHDNFRDHPINPDRASKYVGVSYDMWMNQWRAQMMIDGRVVNLGTYVNEDDAGSMYAKAAYQYKSRNVVTGIYGGLDLRSVPNQPLILRPNHETLTIPYKGVKPAKKRWQAQISVQGRYIHLGTFDTMEEAGQIYANAVYYLEQKKDLCTTTAAAVAVEMKQEEPTELTVGHSRNKEDDVSTNRNVKKTRPDTTHSSTDVGIGIYGGLDLRFIPNQPLMLRPNHETATIPYKGVKTSGNRWRASISVQGRSRHLGSFGTMEEAAQIYSNAVYYMEHMNDSSDTTAKMRLDENKEEKLSQTVTKNEDNDVEKTSLSTSYQYKSRRIPPTGIYGGLDLRSVPNQPLMLRTDHETNPIPYKGIKSHKNRRWQARITIKGGGDQKRIHLGTFTTMEEAAQIYANAAYYLEHEKDLCNTETTNMKLDGEEEEEEEDQITILDRCCDFGSLDAMEAVAQIYANAASYSVQQQQQHPPRDTVADEMTLMNECGWRCPV
jgi:hypothetical protein